MKREKLIKAVKSHLVDKTLSEAVSIDKNRLFKAVNAALSDGFWVQLAKKYPEIKSGDEIDSSKLEREAMVAAKEWLEANATSDIKKL